MIPAIFNGQTVAIVGGGPSLVGFDFAQLDDCNVIAVNRALEFCPRASVLWWSDATFWRNNREKILAHGASCKATGNLNYREDDALPPEIHRYTFTGHAGFDPEPGMIRHGNNSVFAAMHLAVHLAAVRLVLFGVDMKHGPGGLTHFHGGHGVVHIEDTMTRHMLPLFDSLRKPLAKRGVAVVNASPDSALNVWPRCSIAEGVALAREIFPN